MLGTVLFFGRKNCNYSKKLKRILKNKSSKLFYIESNKLGKSLNYNLFKKKHFDFIFSYRSFFILKKNLINRSKFAINFHPGTPEFRGIGCLNFALLNNSKVYGSTCHLIDTKIDSGKIIDVRKFKINKNDDVEKVLNRTHATMFLQAKKIINEINIDPNFINRNIKKLNKVKWSKKIYKLKDLRKLYCLNDKSKEIQSIIRATYFKNFKPYYKIKNEKFFLQKIKS